MLDEVIPEAISPEEDVQSGNKSGLDSENTRDELIFDQDLNEVYLLIDFISGRSDRSLSTLKIKDPDSDKELSTGQILEAISQMRYPPDRSMPRATFRNSTILLLAKDQLSALAQPARGATIAYSAMFVDLEATSGVSIWSIIKSFRQNANAVPAKDSDNREPRVDLARRTFPGLLEHARKFSSWRRWFSRLTLFSVFMTCLVYWDAGHGRSALERLDQVWKTQLEMVTNNPMLLNCVARQAGSIVSSSFGTPRQESEKAGTSNPQKTELELAKSDLDCRRFNYSRWLTETAGKEVQSVFECDGDFSMVHVWCWRWLLSGSYSPNTSSLSDSKQVPPYGEVSPYVKANATFWQNATLILAVYSAFILPMMFALVGALIGSLRRITHLLAESALAPRDLVWMQLAVPMGLVAGIAVALFLTPSSLPAQGTGNLSGQLTLTASGLAFLAGYAAERFFRFLDSVVNTAFPDRLGVTVGTVNRAASTGSQS